MGMITHSYMLMLGNSTMIYIDFPFSVEYKFKADFEIPWTHDNLLNSGAPQFPHL